MSDAPTPPSLASGTKIGPYTVVAELGRGGMGTVYRARDSRLRRDVALKVLPDDLRLNPSRLARFEQEARALAALSHPNIAAIYGIEESTEGAPALVLELIDGETLASRVVRGRLPVTEALNIARQIAEALEAAHEKGIVHRDLKPANIAITSTGLVKVLDFGVAKMADPEEASVEEAVTAGLTREGVVVGTAAYMSPEQARGQAVDKRTDIWAFSCVLYEMLTGHRLFEGDNTTDILAAVLAADPDWSALPPQVPPTVRALLKRCLERERVKRLGDVAAIRFALEDIAAVAPPGGGPGSDARVVAAIAGRHRAGLALAALVLIVAVAGGVYLASRDNTRSSSSESAFSLKDAELVQLTTTGNAKLPAISPDGRYVVYVQRDREAESLWIRQTATASNQRIVPARPNVQIKGATVTPDGNFVDFVTLEQAGQVASTLWRVPFIGGTPRRLVDNVFSRITWSPDGKQMAFIRSGKDTSLIIANADGGNGRVRAVRRAPDPTFFTDGGGDPAWSPDGRVIVAAGAGFETGVLTNYVFFYSESDGSVRAVPQTPAGAGNWLDNSSLLWARQRRLSAPMQLWLLSYPAGELTRLTNDLNNYSSVSLTANRDSFVAARTEANAAIWIGDGAATNGREVLSNVNPPGFSGLDVAWAKDRLLYLTRAGDKVSISTFSPELGTSEETVPDATGPDATSDGRTIAYVAWGEPRTLATIWKADADGRGARQIGPSTTWARVTRDDRNVVSLQYASGKLLIAPLEGGTPTLVADVPVSARAPDLSPDGTLLAFAAFNQERPSILVCSLSACTSRRWFTPPGLTMSEPDGGAIRWMPDNKAVAYVNAQPRPNIWVQPLDGSRPRPLTDFTDGRQIPDFAWSRDGSRLAIVLATSTTDIVLFKGLRPKPRVD